VEWHVSCVTEKGEEEEIMRQFIRLWLPGLLVVGMAFGVRCAEAGTAGSLDTTFGTNGVTLTSVAGVNGIVNSMLMQGNDILVYVGGAAVLRYTPAGALDATFGSNGITVLATPIGGSLALQSNSQIVIGGVVTPSTGGAALGVERLNANGAQDTAFGSGGLALVSLGTRAPNVGSAVLVQPDGNIVVCSTLISVGRGQPYQVALARFTSTGALDTTFGNQGLAIATGANGCTALALLSNGDYLVVNSQAIAQFAANGAVRSAVTGGTVVATSQSSSAFEASIFQANGDYLLGTEVFIGEESRGHNSSGQVLRFTESGSPDPTFANLTFHYVGAGGSGIEALVRGVAVQPNGDIVAVGDQITFTQSGQVSVNGLARLTPTGSLDPTFGNGGTLVNNLPASSAVVSQPDGNIVTAGFGNNNTLTLARYLGK
jgi:uncharacterized delta-60 repeat protein